MRASDVLQEILQSPEEESGKEVRVFFDSANIHVLEENIGFFDGIPTEKLRDCIVRFLEILHYYEGCCSDYYRPYWKTLFPNHEEETQKTTIKPVQKISSDLNKIREFKELLEDHFGFQMNDGIRILPICLLESSRSKERDNICAAYELVKKLETELEEKSFDLIKRSKYYASLPPNKTMLRDYLNELKNQYKLHNKSLLQKELIDGIKPPYPRS